MKYWLIKSEPESYGTDHLRKDKKTPWTGVRNYQARNFMRDDMQVGDQILFYHSNCAVPGVYGTAQVASKPYPDPTQFDPESSYFDPKAAKEKPIWHLVDVSYVSAFKDPVTLDHIKIDPHLEGILVAKRGMRLSVQPVSKEHFTRIKQLGTSPAK